MICCQAALDGDFVKARKMQIEALDVIENLFTVGKSYTCKGCNELTGKECRTAQTSSYTDGKGA